MSASLILSVFSQEELALEAEWLKIRDLFFGTNFSTQDIRRALKLAASCEHEEALYLSKVFVGKQVKNSEEAREIFLLQPEADARALCYSELLASKKDWLRVRRSAELGFSLAQASMAEVAELGEEFWRFAHAAASNRERNGFYMLGWGWKNGVEVNLLKAKESYAVAAELGCVSAMSMLSEILDDEDPWRWFWRGVSARRGSPWSLLDNFSYAVLGFKFGLVQNAACVFQIGRALNGNVDYDARSMFGKVGYYDTMVGPAKDAIAFYKSQLAACRRAVDAWTLVANRFKIVKDMRILIGKMIWETRSLAEYQTNSVLARRAWK